MEVSNPLLASLYEKRDKYQETLDALVANVAEEGREQFNEAETANFNDTEAAIKKLDERIAELVEMESARAKVNDLRAKVDAKPGVEFADGRAVKVTNEAATYRADVHFSYIADLFACQTGRADREAQERMARHAKEMHSFAMATGDVPEVVPPQYLTDDLLRKASNKRVVANLIPQRPWINGMTHYYPRITDVVSVGTQASQNSAFANHTPDTDDVNTAVKTAGGYVELSEQVLSQASMSWDQEVFTQLGEQYADYVENYVLNDATEGLFVVTGTTGVTYTDASPTLGELYAKLGAAASAVASARYNDADTIIMSSRRWNWVKTQVDNDGRPLLPLFGAVVNVAGNADTRSTQGLVGELFGLPVYVSNRVPLTSNDATPVDQDAIIVARLAETRIRESGVRAGIDRGGDAFKNGTVVFRLFGMLSFTAKRAPSEVSIIRGTGLNNPF